MKPNIKDIARLAEVSPTTVSRVLNNRGYISKQTRDKVNQAMRELNYYPNELARSLYHQHTYFIGLIFPTTGNPFFGELIFHIENICASLGYKIFLCNSLDRADKEQSYLEMLQRNQVDGIIVGAHNRLPEYKKINLPIVAIDRYLSDDIPVVASDNLNGGKLATKWLLDHGCREIIHINGPRELETPANKRRDGYEQMMKKAGRTPVTYELPESLIYSTCVETVRQVFNNHPKVDGIFASDDLIAATIFSEARKRGIMIPDELKVVGYDGTETVRICLPYLTTIRQPIKEMAEKAVQVLLRKIKGQFEEENREIILPIRLVEGETGRSIHS
ncbi:LacI family DNA-binding transcriptional regulator [Sporolactobacillus putidus]|uniref:LacI family transcriptional regulator n=1 Tax=Sporolactobacillus putidus TaxID=492735 RepID=A0A917W295_9BACL|nr:LacI family DNA-binding transcriptional regulator [Sporolactobacillus putidus]GGL59631.1 LacI family transcriptional regulator [Sporolactobacillus putidus]